MCVHNFQIGLFAAAVVAVAAMPLHFFHCVLCFPWQ